MTSIPDPKTWGNNDRPDWKEFSKEIFDTLDFLFNPPMCYIRPSGVTNITNDVDTLVIFGDVFADMPGTEAMFSAATPTRITPKVPGRYLVYYTAIFADGACGCSGFRSAIVRKNGSYRVNGDNRDRPGSSDAAFTMIGSLASSVVMNGTTDYLELMLWTTGGATQTGAGIPTNVWFSNDVLAVRWISYE